MNLKMQSHSAKIVSILVVVDVGCDETRTILGAQKMIVSILVVVDVGCDVSI